MVPLLIGLIRVLIIQIIGGRIDNLTKCLLINLSNHYIFTPGGGGGPRRCVMPLMIFTRPFIHLVYPTTTRHQCHSTANPIKSSSRKSQCNAGQLQIQYIQAKSSPIQTIRKPNLKPEVETNSNPITTQSNTPVPPLWIPRFCVL